MQNFRAMLETAFESRRSRNSSFTLRSFAKYLDLMPGQLSEVLSEKKGLSLDRAKKVAQRVGFTEEETANFLDLVEIECSRSETLRLKASERLRERNARLSQSHSLTNDLYQAVSDWHHFAILALTGVPGFKSNSIWIAQQLGISSDVVEKAIIRLLRLEILKKEKQKWVANHQHVMAPDGIPSEAIKNHHAGIFAKAVQSLDQHTLKERDFFETTCAFDPDDLPEMRKKIRQFMNTLYQDYGKKEGRTQVFSLGSFMFPLSSASNRESK